MIYGLLRKIGHRFFPSLIAPYRKMLFRMRDLRLIPAQLADLRRIRRKEYGFAVPGAISMEKHYHGAPNPDALPGIVLMCDGRLLHGGPTDRLRGILSTFRYARARGIPFHIMWDHPFRLEDYLIPAGPVDWRIPRSSLSFSPDEAYPAVIMHTEAPQARIDNALRLRAALRHARRQTHVYSNAPASKKEYRKLFRLLFAPSPALKRETERHSALLGPGYYSFTYRFLTLLGDFPDHLGITLPPAEAEELIEKVCRETLAVLSGIPSGIRVLVTSDSITFLERAARLDPRIYVVPGRVQNIDLEQKRNGEAWLKTFTDQQLIMNASRVYLFRTGRMYRSGFPEFAAAVGGRPFIDHRF